MDTARCEFIIDISEPSSSALVRADSRITNRLYKFTFGRIVLPISRRRLVFLSPRNYINLI